jgi:Signal transduction histidine kinase
MPPASRSCARFSTSRRARTAERSSISGSTRPITS